MPSPIQSFTLRILQAEDKVHFSSTGGALRGFRPHYPLMHPFLQHSFIRARVLCGSSVHMEPNRNPMFGGGGHRVKAEVRISGVISRLPAKTKTLLEDTYISATGHTGYILAAVASFFFHIKITCCLKQIFFLAECGNYRTKIRQIGFIET